MEVIRCKNLTFSYPLCEKKALSNISFGVGLGEFCLVIGESGAGKTTLLKLLKNEIAPVGKIAGEINVDGYVGYVAQNVDESIVSDKVRSELSFGLTNMGLSGSEIELLVAETASYFNLEDKLDYDISSLSGGEKQMLNLASVMIMKPQILVLDEPTAQLDPVASERFINMVKRLHNDFSTTIVISEHNAAPFVDVVDKVLLIEKSRLSLYANVDCTLKHLISTNSAMLGTFPPQMRLFEGAKTVKECRDIISKKQLTPPEIVDEKCDVAVKIKNISFAYEKGYDVLNRLSLNIYQGKINAIVGANSSGKSTLLKNIVGVKKNYKGNIKTNGSVAMLCQNPFDLFTSEKCADEVEFGEITSFLEIDDIKNQHPYDISGGQAVRLALSKVLSTGADIILLDEPTRALDWHLKNKLAQKLNQLCAQGKTIVLVSHDIEFVAEFAHYVSFVSRGQIVQTAQRQKFFTSLNFYTPCVAKITNGIVPNVVSVPDLKKAGGC